MIPKVLFRKMSIEENIEIIKWAYFSDSELLNIEGYLFEYFPLLRDIDDRLDDDAKNKLIEDIVTSSYIEKEKIIDSEVNRYNLIWDKYNSNYMTKISTYLNTKWPSSIKFIDASVGLIPIFLDIWRNMDFLYLMVYQKIN